MSGECHYIHQNHPFSFGCFNQNSTWKTTKDQNPHEIDRLITAKNEAMVFLVVLFLKQLLKNLNISGKPEDIRHAETQKHGFVSLADGN